MPTKPTSTYLLHCFIAGLQYYDVLEIWKCLKIGDQVELIPEPENGYDKNAVMVIYKGTQLGYLPRSENRHIAKILNAGLNPYEARIQSLYQDKPMFERIEICLKIKNQKKEIKKAP
ncbi:MAG: HIRAN domain-containing protein [Flavobacteriaceae bacterium]|nr:HIRAN domain-containing protein [Flavobacteriaceae bacterium]